jgi:hypothetical protein
MCSFEREPQCTCHHLPKTAVPTPDDGLSSWISMCKQALLLKPQSTRSADAARTLISFSNGVSGQNEFVFGKVFDQLFQKSSNKQDNIRKVIDLVHTKAPSVHWDSVLGKG